MSASQILFASPLPASLLVNSPNKPRQGRYCIRGGRECQIQTLIISENVNIRLVFLFFIHIWESDQDQYLITNVSKLVQILHQGWDGSATFKFQITSDRSPWCFICTGKYFLKPGWLTGCWWNLICWTTLEYSCSDLPANQLYSKISNNFASNINHRELVCIYGVVCISKFRVSVFLHWNVTPQISPQPLFSILWWVGTWTCDDPILHSHLGRCNFKDCIIVKPIVIVKVKVKVVKLVNFYRQPFNSNLIFYCKVGRIKKYLWVWFNPIKPCSPCHVFAYNCANTRTSALQNLTFPNYEFLIRFLPH